MQLPNLGQRQLEILLLLYKFRFLNGRQIQVLLNQRYPNRVQQTLLDLTRKKYLGRIYSRQYRKANKPAVYYLAEKSIKHLKSREDVNARLLNRVYREKARTPKFVSRCLLLADAYLLFRSLENCRTP